MSIPILITSITLAIIAVVFFGGAISSKKLTTESTFFSMGQTNWLRSIAILMVMFSHYYPVLGLSYSDGIISFCLNFGYMGVAIFFLLSGYSIMISKINKPNYLKGFIPKRLLRLYVPFLIVFILDVLLMVVTGKGLKIEDLLFLPLMSLPGTLNWYLKIQLCLYILFYVLAKALKNNNVIVGTSFAICIIYMVVGYITGITDFWYETVFAFPLGMLIACKKDLLFSVFSRRYCVALPISIIVFIICFMPYYLKGGTILEILFILGFLQLIVCLCVRISGSVSSKLFTFLGALSLELYLVHIVLLKTIFSGKILSGSSLPVSVLLLVLFIISAILLSIFISLISKRFLSYYMESKVTNRKRG